MNRHQYKARAAREIFKRMREEDCHGEPVLVTYQGPGGQQVAGLEFIKQFDVQRVGIDGLLIVDSIQISVLAECLPRVAERGLFIAGNERWIVTEPLRADGVIVTAAVRSG